MNPKGLTLMIKMAKETEIRDGIMTCFECGAELVPTSCPDNLPGCCVMHYKCPNCPIKSNERKPYRFGGADEIEPVYEDEIFVAGPLKKVNV